MWLLPGTWTGLMSTAVLNLNNMRDHVKDEKAGKRTVVVAMGWDRAKVYHGACFVIGWAAWWAFALAVEPGQWRGMGWIAIINAFHFTHAWRVWRCEDRAALDPELKRVALSTAAAALFIFVGSNGWSGMTSRLRIARVDVFLGTLHSNAPPKRRGTP